MKTPDQAATTLLLALALRVGSPYAPPPPPTQSSLCNWKHSSSKITGPSVSTRILHHISRCGASRPYDPTCTICTLDCVNKTRLLRFLVVICVCFIRGYFVIFVFIFSFVRAPYRGRTLPCDDGRMMGHVSVANNVKAIVHYHISISNHGQSARHVGRTRHRHAMYASYRP